MTVWFCRCDGAKRLKQSAPGIQVTELKRNSLGDWRRLPVAEPVEAQGLLAAAARRDQGVW